MAKNQETK